MIWALLGIIIGILLGIGIDIPIPLTWTRYTAVLIIGMLDSLLGALRADIADNQYDGRLFLSGLAFNIVVAIGITLLGDKLGLDLYLAVAFVFTWRIFNNLSEIRRGLFSGWFKGRSKKSKE
jgi:small basic protein